MDTLIDKLRYEHSLSRAEWIWLLENQTVLNRENVAALAFSQCTESYGDKVFLRGLIEISSFCKNNCYYCGIRCGNDRAERYRLTQEQILNCCENGYRAGLHTFVLQGGEDPYFTDEILCSIISSIRAAYPDCGITLSLGERSLTSYRALHDAGANRYLLRHETADKHHYASLHPPEMTWEHRARCLYDLKQLGYQTGAGFMVGTPGQGTHTIAADLCFLEELKPHMVGIGPFIPQQDTPFADQPAGSAGETLLLLSLVRLLLPRALLPATTALGTIAANGWEQGILSGANVIMLNLTPAAERAKYRLYDNKNAASVEAVSTVTRRMEAIGRRVVIDRGDYLFS